MILWTQLGHETMETPKKSRRSWNTRLISPACTKNGLFKRRERRSTYRENSSDRRNEKIHPTAEMTMPAEIVCYDPRFRRA